MSDLSDYNEAYDNAETNNKYDTVPEGTYQVFVDEVEIKKTKEKRIPMMAWKFKIMSGSSEGRTLFKNSVIQDNTIGFIKTDLSICKMELAKFSDILGRLHELLNIKLEVKIVNKGDNQNVYIQRLIEESRGVDDNDDIPF
jgi:hypothetical protein